MKRKNISRRATILAAAGITGANASSERTQSLDLSRFRLTFSEEFDRLDVSARGPGTRWIAHTPWNGDFGDAIFADPVGGFPFTVQNGILQIEARKADDGKWRSGLLASVDRNGDGFSQQHGYFEISAKMPGGEGVWPAFWLIGRDRLTPGATHTAEIDILEHYGNQPERYSSAIAVWDRIDPKKTQIIKRRVDAPHGILQNNFNLFGASVDRLWIKFYFNRREVWRTPTPGRHNQPMFILLNLALGSGFPIDKVPNPSHMLVDYVRVWAPAD